MILFKIRNFTPTLFDTSRFIENISSAMTHYTPAFTDSQTLLKTTTKIISLPLGVFQII